MKLNLKKYYYKVYGLNIQSEIVVDEFISLNNNEKMNIDINISYGLMNDEIKEAIESGKKAEYKKQSTWFYIDGVGAYHIYNGNTVIVEPCENFNMQILKVYIMGSVLGIILLQRNTVAIHGGSIVIDNKGCIFTGDKGAGKSTLTTALRQRGYDFVSDDVGAINTDESAMINPGFGYQKLCEDAMVKLGYDTSKFTPFRSDMNMKYIVPALENFVDSKVPFEALFEIEVGDVDKVEIIEITGNDKLEKLIKNIFRIEVLMYCGGMEPQYFKKCIDIAKNIKCYKITRPKDTFTVKEQISLIENVIYKDIDNKLKKLG